MLVCFRIGQFSHVELRAASRFRPHRPVRILPQHIIRAPSQLSPGHSLVVDCTETRQAVVQCPMPTAHLVDLVIASPAGRRPQRLTLNIPDRTSSLLLHQNT